MNNIYRAYTFDMPSDKAEAACSAFMQMDTRLLEPVRVEEEGSGRIAVAFILPGSPNNFDYKQVAGTVTEQIKKQKEGIYPQSAFRNATSYGAWPVNYAIITLG
ncbi:MAG: hypothetical protein WC521_09255 [Bdellovibrionales bacterium]|jgi:GDP-D-mannose dehydratase